MASETWGDFEVFLDRVVGRGGTSIVYEARQISLDRPCVVKVLDTPNPELREELLNRFRNEARLIARVRDPRIIPVYQSGEHRGRLWLAMEKADGGTLETLISNGTLIPEDEVRRIGREIACGLQSVYEQERIIHRDIKPSNIFLTRTQEIRIADFGLAKVVSGRGTKLTDTGTVMGTPAYLAPEIIRGDEVDHRADMYALGCLLYEMLVQLPPFDGDSFVDVMYKHVNQTPSTPRELRPDVSESLNAVVMRCLSKQKESRFPDYPSLIAALENEPASVPVPARSRFPLIRLTLGLAAGAFLVIAAVLVAFQFRRSDPALPPAPAPAPIVTVRPPAEAAPTFEERWGWCLELLQRNPQRAVEEATKLGIEYPERKEIADLVLRAKVASGEITEPIGDARFDPVLKHLKEFGPALRFQSLDELESMIHRMDELLAWAEDEKRDPISRSMAYELVSRFLGQIGASEESEVIGARGEKIYPPLKRVQSRISHPLDRVIESANTAYRAGDLGPAKRLRSIAQRFRLQNVLNGLTDVERELHAEELLETGNHADVLQNYSGTRAHGEVTEKARADWRRWNRKNWIASPDSWTKRGPDLSKSRIDFAPKGLSIQTESPAYAECSQANAEQGFSVDIEGEFEEKGWAAVVLNPDKPVHISIFKDRVELQCGKEIRAQKAVKGALSLEVVPYRDHILIYLQGEYWTSFHPGELTLDSIVRIGACKGAVSVKKVEVPE